MKYLLILLLLSLSYLLTAQSQETLDKIEAARIALITERLELSPEQAEKFWPIYREYSQSQRSLRNEFQQLRSQYNPKTSSEEENRKMLERGMQIKERQLDMEKNYTQRMQQVVSTQQILSLRKAEDDFRQMLMNRIQQQQRQRDQLQNNRQRNLQEMQRKRNN